MGKANVGKMRKRQGELKSSTFTLPEGETILYICPPPDNREMPFVECKFHYGYSADGKGSAICMDKKNPLWDDPEFKKAVKEAGKSLAKECAVCAKFLEVGREQFKSTSRWYWNVIPMKFRQTPQLPFQPFEPKVEIFPCGYKIWDAIVDIFAAEGDITDPDAGVFVRIKREGTGMTTQYKSIAADTPTIKKPQKMGKAIKALIKSSQKEDANIMHYLTNLVRSEVELSAAMEGVQTDDDEGEKSDEATTSSSSPADRPRCFGTDCDLDDDECQSCDSLKDCADEMGIDLDSSATSESKSEPESDDDPEPEPESESDDGEDDVLALEKKLKAAKVKAAEKSKK